MARIKCCSVKILFLVTLALLALLVVMIIVAFIGIPAIIDGEISEEVRLEQGTDQWDRFVDLPVPFDIQVYIYHIKNPDEVMNGSLPDIEERGPYHYKEMINKTIYDTDHEEGSVTYTQKKSIVFDAEKSEGLSEDDIVTIVNPAMTVIAQTSSPIELLAAVGCLDKIFEPKYNKMFIDLDVRTAVLIGFPFASEDMDPGIGCSVVRQTVIAKGSKIKNIEVVRDPQNSDHVIELRFAFLQFRLRGVSQDGLYTVNRGVHHIDQLGNIMRWNESETLPFWGRLESINNETCRKVRGRDATIYPPRLDKDDSFEIFSPDICRVIKIDYNGTGTYKGIEGYRFVPSENTLKSATANPENDCYCTKSVSDQTGTPSCWLDGVVDVMPCFHAPVLFSWPHFLYADEYRNGFTGVEAGDPEKHQTYLLVEPNTGTPLVGTKRVQLNLVMRPVQFMPITEKLPRTVVPTIWLDEGVSLTDDLIDELNNKYFDKLKLASGIKYALIALSAAAFCVSAVFLIRKKIVDSRPHSTYN